ncbi:AAA family ATPase [Natrinema longum]|uniref:AAA family ATPase n=1 Tax=Natrinema longum TaxID=370324 RepID=UPI001CCC658C|nr:MoxR family ATPase [Natrinema longum]MBZ6496982.1 MoxR family ATPase [Natrinema longum]
MSTVDPETTANSILDAVSETVVTDGEFLKQILSGIVANGHLLIEDVPGTGKTLTARSIARASGLSFKRIQFTPDLLPADVTGSYIFNEEASTFEFRKGPVFANVVLADEINRAPPKTQAALLEAMAEGQVTVDGTTHSLPSPFCVIATMNPVEQEGTFTLPEAQLDRFWLKTEIGYPDFEGELSLLLDRTERTQSMPTVEQVATREQVIELQTAAESVTIDEDLCRYILEVARETRSHSAVAIGVSPRGAQRLLEVARVWALLDGRDYVIPHDIKTVAESVLAHRIVLEPESQARNVHKADIIADGLSAVEVPTTDEHGT